MDKFGIQLFGKNFSMTDEKLLVCVHDIDVSGQLTQGWWDIPNGDILNANDYSEDEILVFANRSFIKYFDGHKQTSGEHYDKFNIDGFFYYYRPFIRKYNGKFQIRIVSTIASSYENFEGVKIYNPYTYHWLDGRYFNNQSLKSARIRLKIVVPLKRIKNVPEYGIAVYDESGNCKYCNSSKGYAKRLRIHNTALSSSKINYSDLNHVKSNIEKGSSTKLGDNEFVLVSPLGYYDLCRSWNQRATFEAGEVIPVVKEDGTVKILATTEFAPLPGRKHSFPSQSSEYYSNLSIINPLLLIAEF